MQKSRFSPALALAALLLPMALPVPSQAQVAPFAGGPKITVDQAMKEAPKVDPTLVPLEKSFAAAEAKLKKNPKDAKAKKEYVETGYKFGHEAMMRGQKSPKVMYRASLGLFRKVLKVDPKHKPSLDEKKTIEDIYKSMGIGVPQ